MQSVMVGIKRVVDYNVRVRVKADGSGLATEGLKTSINPFDEIALEAALRLKEAGAFKEVVVVTLGPAAAERERKSLSPFVMAATIDIFSAPRVQSQYARQAIEWLARAACFAVSDTRIVRSKLRPSR